MKFKLPLTLFCLILISCEKGDIEIFDSKPIFSSSLNGKWVLVNYWADWCPPCIKEIPEIVSFAEKYPEAIISIDTFRSEVAAKALESGASLVNDISAGNLDPEIVDVVASKGAPYRIMHMRGTPQTMQTLTNYDDVVLEVFDFLREKVSELQERGIMDIIIDPGFGFSKTLEQNYVLLRNLAYFHALELPILVGMSRKSMIFKKLGIRPEDALNGTTVLNTIALTHGAGILRVHDVKKAMEVVTLFEILDC